MWQWSKGAADTLSGKQESKAASPSNFSVKQDDGYNLNCKFNTATDGLKVTFKTLTNSEAVQKELKLSLKVELGAEHKFAPHPRPQQPITMNCSYPQSTPSLKRVTDRMPFPADLVETLRYSAAYIDHAGYMAEHAVKQFNQLDKSYYQLEKKSELRGTQIMNLKDDVSQLNKANKLLTTENEDLKKQFGESREKAKKDLDDLNEKYDEKLNLLSSYESQIELMGEYITEDALEDMKTNERWEALLEKNDEALKQALKERDDFREKVHALETKLQERRSEVVTLKTNLEHTNKELRTAKERCKKLEVDYNQERSQKDKLQVRFEKEQKTRDTVEKELEGAKKVIVAKDETIKEREKDIASKQNQIVNLKTRVRKELNEAIDAIDAFDAEAEKKEKPAQAKTEPQVHAPAIPYQPKVEKLGAVVTVSEITV
jgi:chromosome segregation ATPase